MFIYPEFSSVEKAANDFEPNPFELNLLLGFDSFWHLSNLYEF